MYDFLKYYIILFLFAATVALRGEDLVISGIAYENYPVLKTNFYYFNALGEPIDVSKSDLSLKYNSSDYPEFQLNKGGVGEFKRPLIIAVDNSETITPVMRQQIHGAVQKLIDAKTPNEEYSIISFGKFITRLSGFSKDKIALSQALKLGEGYSVSDISSLFFDGANGIFLENGNRKSSVVLITNGMSLNGKRISEIIARSKTQGIKISVIQIGGIYDRRLKDLADSSEGLNFYGVNNEAELAAALYAVRANSNSIPSNSIEFLTLECEVNPVISIKHTKGAISNFLASIPQSEIPKIEYPNGETLDFGVVKNQTDKIIELTAKGGDIYIDSVVSDNPKFKVINFTPGYLLKKDAVLPLTTRFIPTDSNFEFGSIRVYANICEKAVYFCYAGNREAINKKNLKILAPNGGEKFLAGSVIDLKWLGVANEDSVSLEYSVDGGSHWIQFDPSAPGTSKKWLTPAVESNNCLLRVKKLSDKPDMSKILVLNKHKEKITSIVWRADSKQLATAGTDGNIFIWDAETGKVLDSLFQSIKKPIQSISWSPDGKFLAIASLSNSIKIFNIDGDFQETELFAADSNITQIRWSPWGVDIFAADKAGKLFRWTNLDPTARYAVKIHNGEINDFEINPSGENIATCGVDGKVNLVDFQTGSFIKTIYQSSQPINGIAFSPQGKNIAIANGGTATLIYDVEKGSYVFSLFDNVQPVLDVDWSPDGEFIATISSSKTVKLWQASSANLFYSYSLHENQPNIIKFNTGGSKIASAEPGAVVHVWSPYDVPFEKKSLESDESDSVFSIVPAKVFVERLNLPIVEAGESVVYTQLNAVKNLSEIPIKIDSLKIVGALPDAYEVLSNRPVVLQPGESVPAVVRFSPPTANVFPANFKAYTQTGVFSAEAMGQGVGSSFESLVNVIDFGVVLPGKNRDTTLDALQKKISGNLEITSIRKLNPSESAFTFDEGYSKILDINNPKLTMDLSFSPGTYGDYSQTLEVNFKNSPVKAYILLVGNSSEESLAAPLVFDFGAAICGDSLGGRVRLRNTGSKTINVDSVRIVPEGQAFSIIGNYSDLSIEQGQEGIIDVAFNTNESGEYSARLEIYANGRVDYITSAMLRGRRSKASYSINAERLDMTDIEPNAEKTGTFSVINDGEVPIRLEYQLVSEKFEIVSPADPILLDVGETAPITVKFRGGESGFYQASLKFKDSCGSEKIVALSASIGQPNARITEVFPIRHDTLTCATSKEIAYDIKNVGTTLLTLNSITFSPNDQKYFSVVSSFEALKPDSIGRIIFAYNSQNIGENAVRAILHTNAVNVPNGDFETELKTSYYPYSFTLDATELKFKTVPQGGRDTLSFAVANTGALSFNPVIRPPGVAFNILSDLSPIVPGGGTSTISVEFHPMEPEKIYLDSAIIETPCGDSKIVYLHGESTKAIPIDTSNTLIDTSGRVTLSHIYSNPNLGDFGLQFFLPNKGALELEVVDLLGARIALLENGDFERGLYKKTYAVRGMASGAYFLRFTFGSQSFIRKLYIIK